MMAKKYIIISWLFMAVNALLVAWLLWSDGDYSKIVFVVCGYFVGWNCRRIFATIKEIKNEPNRCADTSRSGRVI